MPETNWRLYCLARHQCPAIIRQQNSSECLMNENSLTKLSSPVSQAEEGMSPSAVPCRGASPLLLHSSLAARWSRELQDGGLPGRTAVRKHRSGSLVMWALACHARGCAGGLWLSCDPMHWHNPSDDPQSCPCHTARRRRSRNPRSPGQPSFWKGTSSHAMGCSSIEMGLEEMGV